MLIWQTTNRTVEGSDEGRVLQAALFSPAPLEHRLAPFGQVVALTAGR